VRLSGLADKLAAVLWRDLLTAVRYRSGFLITAAGAAVELAAFYYLARAVGPQFRPGGMDYFPFLLVGTGFYTFFVMVLHSFLQVVQEAQRNGTIEILMTTSTPAPVLILLSAVSALFGSVAQFVLYVLAGLALSHMPLPPPNAAGCMAVFALSLVIAAAMGFLAASLQLAMQKGSAVVWLFGSAAWLATGTLFPAAELPRPLRLLSEAIPLTHSLNGMRLALLEGAGWAALGREIAILAFFALILLPLGLLCFSYTLRQARREGTLSFY